MASDYESHLVLKWLIETGFHKTAMAFEEESEASLHGYSGKILIVRDLCFSGEFDKLLELITELLPDEADLISVILSHQLREELAKVSTRAEMSAFVDRLTRNRDRLPGGTYWTFVDAATVGAPKDHKVFWRWRGDFERYELFGKVLEKLEPLFPHCIAPISLRDYDGNPLSRALEEYNANHLGELDILFQRSPDCSPQVSHRSPSDWMEPLEMRYEFHDPNSPHPIRGVAFSNSGTYLAIGTHSNSIILTSPPPMDVICKSSKLHAGSVYTMAWSSDDNFIATGSNDQLIRVTPTSKLLNPRAQREQGVRLQLQLGTARAVAFSTISAGTIIAGFSSDSIVREIEFQSGVVVNRFDCSQLGASVNSVSVLNNRILAACSSGAVCLFDARNPNSIEWKCRANDLESSSVADMATDGTYIAIGDSSGQVSLWDVRKSAAAPLWVDSKMHAEAVRAIKFDHSGGRLATASFDKTVRVTNNFSTSNDSSYVLDHAHSDRIVGLDWSRDGKFLASSGTDSRVVLYS